MYGYDIVKQLRGVDTLVVREGTVYPILSRLRRDGLVARRSRMFTKVSSAAVLTWAIVLIMVTPTAASAQSDRAARLMGTWSLNLAASTFDPGPAPGPPTANTTTLEFVDGALTMDTEFVNSRGRRRRQRVAVTFDGGKHVVEGALRPTTRTFRWIDDRTLAWDQRVEGTLSNTFTAVLGEDGRTMTVTTTADRNVLVFDKQ